MHGQNLSDMKYDRLNLHLLADVLLQPNIDFKIITGHNKIWIYTNTIKLIDQIATLYFIVGPTYKQVFINRPRDTIRLKNSAYHQRTYFKSCTMTSTEKNNIIDFFTTHADNIRLSPRLKSFINHTNSHNYILDYFFVDYIDDYWLTLLMLKFPNIVRKTLKIVTA
jgi:hypothetical protein